MDTRLNYPQMVKKILLDYASYCRRGGVDIRPLFDEQRESYMLLTMGWYDDRYIHNATLHLEIIADKIWIQNDDTEEGIATDLFQAGVPNTDIVLGFRHPKVRPYTEFATG